MAPVRPQNHYFLCLKMHYSAFSGSFSVGLFIFARPIAACLPDEASEAARSTSTTTYTMRGLVTLLALAAASVATTIVEATNGGGSGGGWALAKTCGCAQGRRGPSRPAWPSGAPLQC